MSYQINTSNGALLVDLADGQIDTSSTDLTLIGRNYTGFGEAVNENFVKLLENFANASEPNNPITGQLWWDTSENRLKVYTGTNFTTGGGPLVGAQRPDMVAGDLWINNETNQIYFFDGEDLVLIGPIYSAFQGVSGAVVDSVLDSQSTSRTIIKYYIGNTLVGVYSKVSFTPQNVDTIPGFTGDVKKGFTVVDQDFKYNGTADSADNLIDSQGNTRSAAQFLPSDRDGTTVGTLRIVNNGGLTVGLSENNIMKVVGSSFITENQLTDHDYKIRVRTPTGPVDAITVDTSLKNVGIFQETPAYTLDVNGSLRVAGNFVVEGNTVNVETTQLRVEDKNIELAITSDSTALTDADVDGGGIILQSSQGSKDFIWNNNTNCWTSNVGIDFNRDLRVNGTVIIRGTEGIGITSLGALENLNVDNINLDGYRITASGSNGLQIQSDNGDITVINSAKMRGLGTPNIGTRQSDGSFSGGDADDYVATKGYVDNAINQETLAFSLDITGMQTPNSDIITQVLNVIAPVATRANGSEARIHCTDTTTATATLTANALNNARNPSSVTVQELDPGNGTDVGTVSVLQDLTFSDVTGNITLTVNRTNKLFRVENGAWTYVQDL